MITMYDTIQKHPELQDTPIMKHYKEMDAKLKARKTGIHTEMIKGHPAYVQRQLGILYSNLDSKYGAGTWRVIDTTSHAIPIGVCMYVTYEVF